MVATKEQEESDQEALLERFLATRSVELRNQLIERNIKYVEKLAWPFIVRYSPSLVSRVEIIGAGNWGLVNGVEDFRPEFGTKLSSYLFFRIRKEMLNLIRHANWVPAPQSPGRRRAPQSKEDLLLEDVLDHRHTSPMNRLVSQEECLENLVAQLKERERMVIMWHYRDGLEIKDIAILLGIERSFAYRIHSQALDKLRKRIRAERRTAG